MGQTGHLALAFQPTDKALIIAMLNGEGEEDDSAAIRHQPSFDLVREDSYEVHRVLETLGQRNSELAALGTIVIGSEAVCEIAMGIQYFHSAQAVGIMAKAYAETSPDALTSAIEKIRPEFDAASFEDMPNLIREKFSVMRDDLAFIANNRWAMIAGMF